MVACSMCYFYEANKYLPGLPYPVDYCSLMGMRPYRVKSFDPCPHFLSKNVGKHFEKMIVEKSEIVEEQ